jgi:D-3-phosphoglycerate dehydrogenase
MKILVVGDSYCPSASLEPAFHELARNHDLTFADVTDEPGWKPLTPSERKVEEYLGSPGQVVGLLEGHDVLVVQAAPVTDAVIEADPGLRLICSVRGGPVNVDLSAASERGVPVVTTPGKNAQAVAELTLALMVMLARRMPEIARYVEAGGEVGRDNYEGAKWFGHDLEGHILGLVGYGRVGQKVARLALAFGMQVLVYDPYVDPEAVRAPGIEPADLDTLMARSDYVSLHARATPDNNAMIGREQFARMKRGASFINTARDTLVDEDALYDALRSGQIGGVGLDVVRPPDPGRLPNLGRRHRLLDAPNVVITAHIGGATHETLLHGGEMAAAEIARLAARRPLKNVVNRASLEKAPIRG